MLIWIMLIAAGEPNCPPCICVCNSPQTQFFDGWGIRRDFSNADITQWHVPSAFMLCLKSSGPAIQSKPMCGWYFDVDFDGDVDLHDWALLERRVPKMEVVQGHCLWGQERTDAVQMFIRAMAGPFIQVEPEFRGQDRDHNGTVDLADYALLMLTGK